VSEVVLVICLCDRSVDPIQPSQCLLLLICVYTVNTCTHTHAHSKHPRTHAVQGVHCKRMHTQNTHAPMPFSATNFPNENILVESGEPQYPSPVLITSSVAAVRRAERNAVLRGVCECVCVWEGGF
jgi:hypothetical protein